MSLINLSVIISRLEFATERIAYLENKMKELNDDRNEDINKLSAIISKSKEFFQELFTNNESESMNESHVDK
jgi:hypothetical protein